MTISVVQSAQNLGTDAGGNPTVTVTLGSPTTAGNCLVVMAVTGNNSNNATVSGVTLGGSAGNFASLATAGTISSTTFNDYWADPNCAGGQTAVTVTLTGGTGTGWANVTVLEVSGLAATSGALLDLSASSHGNTGTSWSSGATSTTGQAAELWIGSDGVFAANTITGPSSPWVNLAQQNGSGQVSSMAGYQVVSSTGAAAYSGTYASSGNFTAGVVTLKGAAGGGATVALTAPNLALAAPVPAVSAGAIVALTAPNLALAAPLVSVKAGAAVALTAPNVALAAPVPSVSAAAVVALTAPNLALAAPLVSASAGGTPQSVSLTAPNLALAAPVPAVSAGAIVALTAPNLALAAPVVTTAAGTVVPLTAPNLALAAPVVSPSAGAVITLTAPGVALAAPAVTLVAGAAVALTAPGIALAAPPLSLGTPQQGTASITLAASSATIRNALTGTVTIVNDL